MPGAPSITVAALRQPALNTHASCPTACHASIQFPGAVHPSHSAACAAAVTHGCATSAQRRTADACDGWFQPSALALALGSLLQSPVAAAQEPAGEVEFDRQALINRGLDPALADLFRHTPRFAPGVQRVALQVNGRRRGQVDARFNDSGELRATLALLRAAGLHLPDTVAGIPEEATFDLREAWPQAVVRAEPTRQELHLVLPADAVNDEVEDRDDYHHGGTAALLNYDASSSTYAGNGQRRTSYNAYTELGLNTGGWILRSRQSINQNNGDTQVQVMESFAQRSLPRQRKLFQAGELAVASPLFGGVPIFGVQLLPEDALIEPEGGGPLVEGIANSEARVEIRQDGMLLHSTLVPPGPFSLGGFTARSNNSDLKVTVHEEGGEQQFLVPAASFNRASLARPGTTLAAGQLRAVAAQAIPNRTLLTASSAWRLPGADAVLSGGTLLTNRYQAVGLGLDQVLHGNSRAIISGRTTIARSADAYGLSMNLRLSKQWGPLRMNLGASQRSRGYRDLHEHGISGDDPSMRRRVKWQVSTGLGTSSPRWGNSSLSWSHNSTFEGTAGGRLVGSWARKVGRGTLTASLESSHGRLQHSGRSSLAAYASLSFPLGRASVRANLRQRDGRDSLGVDASGRFNQRANWRLGAQQERAVQTRRQFSAGAGMQLSKARVAASMTLGESSRSVNTQLSGGMVLHSQGLTFSPQRVQDTFGIATVGSVKGVRLNAGGGYAWTDRKGRAVLSDLRPYADTRVEVDGTSLPRRADLDNGTRSLRVARGSVSYVSFKVELNQRAFLTAALADGRPMPKGLTVLADGEFITATVEGGRFYLPSYQPEQRLQIVLEGGQRCDLDVSVPTQMADDAFFLEGAATCKA